VTGDTTLPQATSTTPATNQTEVTLTVTYPNGGETIPYGQIYLAGDLYFNWTTSEKGKYTPTSNLKAYVIDIDGNTVRDDPLILAISVMNLGEGGFRTSFADSWNLKPNGKYKIKVCDYIGTTEYCDSSDDFFSFSPFSSKAE
jgi:hypothetical protein